MSLSVTNQDRKNVKSTCLVLGIILAIFTCLTTLFGVLIPRAKEVKALGEDKEEIYSMIEGEDGDDYFLMTKGSYTLYRFDSFTDEQISTFEMSKIADKLKEKGDYGKLIAGSLTQWSVKCIDDLDQTYFLAYDGGGNIFKLLDDGVNLTVTDDYYLAESATAIKGCDNVEDDLYVLAKDDKNLSYVRKYSVSDLKDGYGNNQKLLWNATTKENGKELTPMKSADMGVLTFDATKDGIYLFLSGGTMLKVGMDMVDAKVNGVGVDYFELADAYYGSAEYTAEYNKAYKQFFIDMFTYALSSKDDETKAEYPQEKIDAATAEQIITYYTEIGGLILPDDKGDAKEYAAEKAGDAFIKNNPWCESYDKNTQTLVIDESYLDASQYSIARWEDSINGVVFSKKNNTAYFANATDGYLYSVEKSDMDKMTIGSFFDTVAKKIETVCCEEGQTFSDFGNGISYNKFANTLFLKFKDERTVSIVDLNDKENYEIIHTFAGSFHMFGMTGDKDNEVTHVLYQAETVALDGTPSTHMYACTYQPERFANKTLTTWVFVICLVLTVIVLIMFLWLFIALKNDRSMYKVKVIQRDFKKNKYVYLALTFFVILLCMFCYYEAIGAISMSFFNYTRDEPAWIWNNFGNYLKIFNQDDFLLSVGNMLFFLVFDLILSIVPPLVFAFLLILIRNQTASNWIRSLMFIPGIIPSMATMLIWREGIYGADGVFNQLIGGETIHFLANSDYARWSLILMGFPFVGGYLIFYGGMINIPHEYHEAGWLEGLGLFKRFILVDIPLILPQIKYIFIMTFIGSVQNYARTYILGSAGTKTPVESMYRAMTEQADYGMASAYATIIFAFLFVAVATNFKMQKKETMGDDL